MQFLMHDQSVDKCFVGSLYELWTMIQEKYSLKQDDIHVAALIKIKAVFYT